LIAQFGAGLCQRGGHRPGTEESQTHNNGLGPAALPAGYHALFCKSFLVLFFKKELLVSFS
jgi:hypothetical protein